MVWLDLFQNYDIIKILWKNFRCEVKRIIRNLIRDVRASAAFLAAADPKPIRVKPVADLVQLLLMPVQLLMMKWVVDRLQTWNGGQVEGGFIMLAGSLAVVMTLQAVIGRASLLSLNRLTEIGAYEVERAVLGKTSKLGLALLESPTVKDLRTRALRVVPEAIFMNGTGLLIQIPQTLILLSILGWYGHWLFVAALFLVLPLQLLVRFYTARSTDRLEREQIPQCAIAQYIGQAMTSRHSAQEIRLFGLAENFQARWMRLHREMGRQWLQCKKKEQLALMPSELAVSVISGLMAAIVLTVSASKGQSAGEVAILLQIAIMLGGLWPDLLNKFAGFRQQALRWEDLMQFLRLEEDPVYAKLPEEKPDNRSTAETDAPARSLLVTGLSFTYPGSGQPLLQHISFHIEPGEKIAIVGENGAGKSTLVKLLMGLYSPDSGSIQWYRPSGMLSAAEAAGSFTAVMQDFTKMNLSVREQVALGRIEYLHDDGELAAAMKKADADRWGLEWDERLGPEFGGKELSGGQWQRLAAARAYVREGSVLFFDEPTSALDPQAEKAAIADFLRIAGRRTAFLVTHRLGAAREADRILVLRQGRLVEQGTHRQLIELKGEYERLYRLQASWYL